MFRGVYMRSSAFNWLQQQQPFNGRLSGPTRVGRYQKKHSPAHTHPGQPTFFITCLHLQRSTASSLFSLHAWQSSRTTSRHLLITMCIFTYILTYLQSGALQACHCHFKDADQLIYIEKYYVITLKIKHTMFPCSTNWKLLFCRTIFCSIRRCDR